MNPQNQILVPLPPIPQEQTVSKIQPHTPIWIVSLLLLFFPLPAWYFMLKDKYYHSWLPHLNYLNGLLISVFFLSIIFFVVPKLDTLYTTLGVKQELNFSMPFGITLISFGIFQFFFGHLLNKELRVNKSLPKTLLFFSILFLFIDYLVLSFLPTMVLKTYITPIYRLINIGF